MQLLINIDVPDLDAALAFYTRAFGLHVGRRIGDAVELLGALSPRRFPAQALSERVAGFALTAQDATRTEAFVAALRADRSLDDAQRERALDNTAAALRESRGLEAALRVFTLNTRLYPRSAKAWQRLADALQANGDADAAQAARQRQNALSDTQD